MDSENNETSEFANSSKKSKYTPFQQPSRFNSTGPFLGFEDEHSITPTPPRVRTTLYLESRFFPEGIKPGEIVEVKGPENCGKTFLLTYFLALLLRDSPTKKAVLIDTSHQFSMRNLISIVSSGKDFKKTHDKSLSISQIVQTTPELEPYLDRLIIIKCNSVEEFMLTVVFEENSVLNKLVMQDPEISLVTIDTIDCYSFSNSTDRNLAIDVLAGLKKNCDRIPVICSTIGAPSNFQIKKKDIPEPDVPAPEGVMPWFSNIKIDPTLFTHTLSIVPATMAEKAADRPPAFKNTHYAKAYLRSKQRANMAGSAIHRVKFSIFSDMLWVVAP